MRLWACFLLVFGATWLCGQTAAQDAEDAKNLQGAWALTELIVGGKIVPEKEVNGLRFVFAKDKLTIVPSTDEKIAKSRAQGTIVDKGTFTFKLDSKAKPARATLTVQDGQLKGVVSTAIYEIKGNTLRWCQSDDPTPKHPPQEFVSANGSGFYLFTFTRTK